MVDRIPTGVHLSATNHAYLTAKVNLGSHTMIVPGRVGPPISDVALIR